MLICIGHTASKVSLTTVPMMEGIQVILGRDWLDTVNPLIDWKTNSLVLQHGDGLEVVQGIKTPDIVACNIVDRGLPGLQHTFHSLGKSDSDPNGKVGDSYAQLCSPSFWEPTPLVREWAHIPDCRSATGHDSPRAVESPQGGVAANFLPNSSNDTGNETPEISKGVHRKKIKVAGRLVSQPVRPKIDFMSMRQAAKRANKSDLPMFLCLLRPTECQKGKEENARPKLVQQRAKLRERGAG